MLDLGHISNSQQDIKIYQANGSAWQTWQKPRKCSYVWIMCIGGAGGGAGGNITVGTFSTGGGSAAISRALYNAQILPDTLYVQVGLGGAGGASATNGSAGTRSWVTLSTVVPIVAQNVILGSAGAAAAGGSITGATAAGETAITTATSTFSSLSTFISTGGQGSPTVTPYNPLTSQVLSPGAIGPQYNDSTLLSFAGGDISATSISPLIAGGTIGGTGSGGNGANGIFSWKPFFSLGGAGGGSSYADVGGNGGNGGIGSGGGAGGAGKLAGGTGGKGGDGLVVIISF